MTETFFLFFLWLLTSMSLEESKDLEKKIQKITDETFL